MPLFGVAFFIRFNDLFSFMSFKFRCILSILLVSVACGCASYAPHQGNLGRQHDVIGETRNSLIARMGSPEREELTQGVRVLHYPRGPRGHHTYFVYLDREDRVINWEQVLTEERFNRITPGMTEEQVIGLIGVSKITHGLARERGYVWHYRYYNYQCKSFVIEFTTEHVVRSAGYLIRGGRRCHHVGP